MNLKHLNIFFAQLLSFLCIVSLIFTSSPLVHSYAGAGPGGVSGNEAGGPGPGGVGGVGDSGGSSSGSGSGSGSGDSGGSGSGSGSGDSGGSGSGSGAGGEGSGGTGHGGESGSPGGTSGGAQSSGTSGDSASGRSGSGDSSSGVGSSDGTRGGDGPTGEGGGIGSGGPGGEAAAGGSSDSGSHGDRAGTDNPGTPGMGGTSTGNSPGIGGTSESGSANQSGKGDFGGDFGGLVGTGIGIGDSTQGSTRGMSVADVTTAMSEIANAVNPVSSAQASQSITDLAERAKAFQDAGLPMAISGKTPAHDRAVQAAIANETSLAGKLAAAANAVGPSNVGIGLAVGIGQNSFGSGDVPGETSGLGETGDGRGIAGNTPGASVGDSGGDGNSDGSGSDSSGGSQAGTGNTGGGGSGNSGNSTDNRDTISQMNPNPAGENQSADVVDPANIRNVSPNRPSTAELSTSNVQTLARVIENVVENNANDIQSNITDGIIAADDVQDVIDSEAGTAQSSVSSHPAFAALAEVLLSNILTSNEVNRSNHIAPNQAFTSNPISPIGFIINNFSVFRGTSPAAAADTTGNAPRTVGSFTTTNITGTARPGPVNQSYVDNMNRALTALQQKYPGLQVNIFSGTHTNPNHDPAKEDGVPSGRHAHGNGGDTTFSRDGIIVTDKAILADIAQTLANVDPGVGIGYSNKSKSITHVDFESTTNAAVWGYGGGVPASLATALANGRKGQIASGVTDPSRLNQPEVAVPVPQPKPSNQNPTEVASNNNNTSSNTDSEGESTEDNETNSNSNTGDNDSGTSNNESNDDSQDDSISIDDVVNQASDEAENSETEVSNGNSTQGTVGPTPANTDNNSVNNPNESGNEVAQDDTSSANFGSPNEDSIIGPNPSEVRDILENGFPAPGSANQDNKTDLGTGPAVDTTSSQTGDTSTETGSVPTQTPSEPTDPAPAPTDPEDDDRAIFGIPISEIESAIDSMFDAYAKAVDYLGNRKGNGEGSGSGIFERMGRAIQDFGRVVFRGESTGNQRYAEFSTSASADAYIPILITIDESAGEVQFLRGNIQHENFESFDNFEPIYEIFNDAPASLVVSEKGEIIYSDGTYAPPYINGKPVGDDETEYVYLIERVNEGKIIAADVNKDVIPGNIITQTIKRVFSDTTPFTIDDVDSITYEFIDPNTDVPNNEYHEYTILLLDDSKRTVSLPVTTSLSFYKDQLEALGYNGDVFALINKAEETGRKESTQKPGFLKQLQSGLKNFEKKILDLFADETKNDNFANLPTATSTNSYKFRNTNLVSARIYLNVPLPCPNLPNYSHGYAYEVVARDSTSTDPVVFYGALCGTGSAETYADEVAKDLVRNEYFERLGKNAVFNVLDFVFYTPEETNESTNTQGERRARMEERVSNSTNDIVFQTKITNNLGQTIRDWSNNNEVSVRESQNLHFRWDAREYDRCLPFLNDNGIYSLQQGDDLRMLTGNTETEGFRISKRSGIYRIECDGQSNGERGVDERRIRVTVE